MSVELQNKEGIAIPSRPDYSDELVITAVKQAFEGSRFCRLLFGDNPSSENIEKFAQDYNEIWCEGADPYFLTKSMEEDGYKVNSQFTDNLEMIDDAVLKAHRAAVKEWFDTYQPIPPFKVGTRLKLENNFNEKHEYGVIEKIYDHAPATYAVIYEGATEGDTTRRLIKFEDAVPAELN